MSYRGNKEREKLRDDVENNTAFASAGSKNISKTETKTKTKESKRK